MDTLSALRQGLGPVRFAGLVVAATAMLVLVLRVPSRLRSSVVAHAAFVVASTGAILVLTLRPLTDTSVRFLSLDPAATFRSGDELFLGTALDNVTLFVPLGAALALFLRLRRDRSDSSALALLVAVSLSLTVEALQFIVPTGRVASLGDVLLNGAGATVGIVLARGVSPAGSSRHVEAPDAG